MKKLKRFLAWMLVLGMVCSFLPVSAFAAETDIGHMANKPADGTIADAPFKQGTGESNSFRIPAMVTLSDGTLVAAADARWNTTYDGGGLDTMVAISEDNGATWTHSFANYLGDNGNQYNGSSSTAFIDPALAVRTENGTETIYMLCDLYPYGVALNGSGNFFPTMATGFDANGNLALRDNMGNPGYYLENGKIYNTQKVEQSGYTVDGHFNIYQNGTYVSNLFFMGAPFVVEETGFLYLTKSTDGGKSWSDPQLLNLKNGTELVCLVGPGRGLVTGGKIVFPVYSYNGNEDSQRMGFIYSSDGVNWERSANLDYKWASESVAMELDANNMRFFFRNGTSQLMYVDYNWTSGWGVPQTTGLYVNSNCQISAIRLDQTIDGERVVLVSCPGSSYANGSNQSGASYRTNGKIFLFTLGQNNALNHRKTLDVPSVHSANNFMYSCMTALTDAEGNETGDIAILYEDQESAWGVNQYYQMSYKTYDVEEAFGVTFGEAEEDPDVPGDEDPKTVAVNLKVGQTVTETIGGVALNGSKDDAVATVTWVGTTTGGGTEEKLTAVELPTSAGGVECYISDGNGNYLSLSGNSLSNETDIENATKWTVTWVDHNGSGNRYTIQSGNYYVVLANNTLSASQTASAHQHYFTPAAGFYCSGNGSNAWVYNNGWTIGTANNNAAKVYTLETVTTEQVSSTAVTITGKTIGNISVDVGEITYNITVTADVYHVENVELEVGETQTFTDTTGNYENSDGNVLFNEDIAGMTVIGKAGIAETTVSTTKTTAASELEDGSAFIIRVSETNYALTSNKGGTTWAQSDGDSRAFEVFSNAEADNIWTLEASGNGYKLKCAEGYLNLGKNAAWITADNGDIFTFTYSGSGWTIGDGTYNIDTLGGLTNYYCAGGWQDSETRFDLYKVTSAKPGFTEITFEGKNPGTTTAIVGTTQYNITVYPDTAPVEIKVPVGGTYVHTDTSGGYDAVTIRPNETIATVKIQNQLVPATEIESGKQYLIVNRATGDILTDTVINVTSDQVNWGIKTGLDTTGKASADSRELWSITEFNGKYTISQNGKYLAVAGFVAPLYDTQVSLDLTYTAGGWTICDSQTGTALGHGNDDYYLSDNVGSGYTGGALGTSDTNNSYIYWDIYEVYSDSTRVEFTGVAEGKTVAVIGNTRYNITVFLNFTDVYIELEVGESFTYTDTTGNHVGNVTDTPDETYATMAVAGTVNGTEKAVEPITASTFEPTNRYILENVQASTIQPDHSVLTSDEATYNLTGLVMNGPLDAATSKTWFIIPDDNFYQLGRNGEYVALDNQRATMEPIATKLTFEYVEGKGWLIYLDGDTDYYLCDLFGASSGEAFGTTDSEDPGNYWNIYKEVDKVTSEATTVTFTAKAEGTATATVGYTNYHITVVPNETDDEIMNSGTGIWTVDPEIQHQRYNALIGLSKDLYTDESWRVYETARQNTYKKLIEVTYAQYDSQEKAEQALAELEALVDALEVAKGQLVSAKTISIRYMLNGAVLDIKEYKVASDETKLELPAAIVVNNTAYTVTTTEIILGDNTTHEVPVTLIGKLGGGFVASTDISATAHNTHDQVCDLVDDTTGEKKKITEMTVTVGIEYTLELAMDITGKSVEWATEDDTVAVVDNDGKVTATGVGTTKIIATVKDANGNVVEVNTIPIQVFPAADADAVSTRDVALYIHIVDNTTVYCVINDDYRNGFQVIEGELIYGTFEAATGDTTDPETTTAISFFADPDEAHALVYMKSTNSDDHYFLLHDDEGNLYDGTQPGMANSDYYVSGTTAGAGWWQAVGLGNNKQNHQDANWDAIKNNVQWAIDHGCDGGLGFTRRQAEGAIASNLVFASNPMPRIEKTIDGVLPSNRKQANYRPYVENMVAAVKEQVYFKITITQEMPTVWKPADPTQGIQAETVGAIAYSGAYLTDTILPGAFLYTKELDKADGTWDGNIDPKHHTQVQEITEELNAPWTEAQKAAGKRSFDFYLVYEIQESDIPKFWIDNIAELSYNYRSHYSTGAQAGAADAEAHITVVGSDIDDVVIDFGQTIRYTGLTNAQLKGVYVDGQNDDSSITACKAEAKYGDVSVTREQMKDEDGEPLYNDKGYPEYTYTVTYTPHSILHDTDAVVLYGIGEKGNEKVINGFLVYPATTVYYEEGFMMNDASTWNKTAAKRATGVQTLELLGRSQYDQRGALVGKISDKKHAYGYDPLYEQEGYTSGNSYASADTIGQTTAFTITGTGFDLYANCDEGTGYVSIQVKNSAGKFVKIFIVDTVVKGGTTSATQGQQGREDHLPIVSADLGAHDTYTISITKVMDKEPVRLDGIRVHNTLADSSVYNIDLEDNPELYQLRDYVLAAVDPDKEASEFYGPNWITPNSKQIGALAEQVYGTISSDEEAPYALISNPTGIYGQDANAQDLLDNGPKNELFLYKDQTLTFKVSTSRAMQIGMKAPEGATSYTLTYSIGETTTTVAEEKALPSSVDMFCELKNPIGTANEYIVKITNTGDKIISITDLKICDDPGAAFVALDVEDIEQMLQDTFWDTENESVILGDLDCDWDVDAEDLTLLARHVGGIEQLTGQALKNADTNRNGVVDAGDLTSHARYTGGIILMLGTEES